MYISKLREYVGIPENSLVVFALRTFSNEHSSRGTLVLLHANNKGDGQHVHPRYQAAGGPLSVS